VSKSKTELALARSAELLTRARTAHIDRWEELSSASLERARLPLPPPAPDSLAPEKTKLGKLALTLLLTLLPPAGLLLLEYLGRLADRLKPHP
jgi:hypothetical protein